jgi:tetratricopeptide (TPR) repeat protein
MSTESPAPAASAPVMRDRFGQAYEPAVSSYLKPVLAFIFIGFAFLGATGAYTSAIRLLNTITGEDHTTVMKLWIDLAHLVGGVLLVVPFVFFGVAHWKTARQRKNRPAISLGKTLFYTGLIVCGSGLALMQLHERFQLPDKTIARWVVYGFHVGSPLLAVVLYVMHRRAGPDIKWKWGIGWGMSVAVFVGAMVYLHSLDPRTFDPIKPKQGMAYFHPSLSRTAGGTFIKEDTFMMDEYCMKCHGDIYKDHLHSAHRFSSFNNPAYLFSVLETRKTAGVQASRWCAGCHDPVPFFSGQFDKEEFNKSEELLKNPTAHAGITCTVCHSITHINSTRGNGDYVIEEPLHYPFAKSTNPLLQYLNNQMVKAKPEFHKKTFLKPFHKTAEFCSTCHKVSLPVELNQYKEFLRGQDHYNTYLLSGVSGVGTRSFYYPREAKSNCAQCHMPLKESNDFGAKDFDKTGTRKVHNHLFPAANTGLPWMLSLDRERFKEGPFSIEEFRKSAFVHADFLRGTDPEGKDRKLRIDLFGVKEGGTIDGKLTVLRPELPKLKPGEKYLVEVVVRTVNLGHPFSQGTVDSNEIWADFQASQKGTVFGRNGGMIDKKTTKGEQKLPDRDFVVLDDRPVDKWAHFINVLMLDRKANRINRRNPQDIFWPLYNHQIPPGAGQVVHYALEVPKLSEMARGKDGKPEPIELKVRLRYRKFDFEYMSLVHKGDDKVPGLPVVDMCEDAVTLPVEGGVEVAKQLSPIKPPWQRWNDYGIGCFTEGGIGEKKGELKQALEAFEKVADWDEKAAKAHGLLNMARVQFDFGNLNLAADLANQSAKCDPPAPWWTVAWLTANINIQNGRIEDAIEDLEKLFQEKSQPKERNFDFRRDFVVLNDLANAYFLLAQRYPDDLKQRDKLLEQAITVFEKTLAIEPEDQDAHFGLNKCYSFLGEKLAQKTSKVKNASQNLRMEVKKLASVFADQNESREKRIEAAVQLGNVLKAQEKNKYKEATKLPICNELWKEMWEMRSKEDDPELRMAAAFVLGQVHGQLFTLFKPDDLARAVEQKYRERPENKAADNAANAIVIYPVHRQ